MTNTKTLSKLKKYGFMWVKNNCTDKVDADCIQDVVPAANGFTVIYRVETCLVASTAEVSNIEVPDEPDKHWIRVYWDKIVDERR